MINLVPFTFLAPLIGPAIDRFPRSHRLIATTVFIIRALLAVGLALTLYDLGFYFFALALFIANRATGITKQALVPGLVDDPEYLVAANSRLSLLSLVAGSVFVPLGAAAWSRPRHRSRWPWDASDSSSPPTSPSRLPDQ